MMNISPSRTASSGSKEKLPTFQELELAMDQISIESSTKEEHPDDIAAVEQSLQMFQESTSKLQSVPTKDSDMDDATLMSVRHIESGSHDQWEEFDNLGTFRNLVMPLGSLAATKELDLVLGDVEPSGVDAMDAMSICLPSEATYDHSEATARTGHVSSNSSSTKKRVTPENSPSRGNKGRGRRQERQQNINNHLRFGSPPQPCKRLVMCGAIDVNNELKESIQDVNATVRQIITTVRRFGPDEKDAIRESFKDAQYFMRDKVRSALVRKGSSDNSRSQEPDQEISVDDNSHKRRRGRKPTVNTSSDHQDKSEDTVEESEEVVYSNRRMLV